LTCSNLCHLVPHFLFIILFLLFHKLFRLHFVKKSGKVCINVSMKRLDYVQRFIGILKCWFMANLNKSTTRHKINYLPSVWIQYENKLLPKLMDSSEIVSYPWSISWQNLYFHLKMLTSYWYVCFETNSSVKRGTCAEIYFEID